MAIKINNEWSFEKTLHGYNLYQRYTAKRKETGEVYDNYHTTFHANINQIASKLLHEAGEDVQGTVGDLLSAWQYMTNSVSDTLKALEDK